MKRNISTSDDPQPSHTHFILSHARHNYPKINIDKSKFIMPGYKYIDHSRSEFTMRIYHYDYGHLVKFEGVDKTSEYHSADYVAIKEAARNGDLSTVKKYATSNEYIKAYLELPKEGENVTILQWSDRSRDVKVELKNNIKFDPFHPYSIAAHELHLHTAMYFANCYPHHNDFIFNVFPHVHEFFLRTKLAQFATFSKPDPGYLYKMTGVPDVDILIMSYVFNVSSYMIGNALKINLNKEKKMFENFVVSKACIEHYCSDSASSKEIGL